MFEKLTLRLGRPDNIRFIGEWVLPFDPNVVLVVTLDVIFLDGLPFVRFCSFFTPHQVDWTEFLEKSLNIANDFSIGLKESSRDGHYIPKYIRPKIPDIGFFSYVKLTSISHSAFGSSSFLIVKDFPVRKFLEAFPLE